MPRAVVITKLDHARANYQNALSAAQNAFGDKVLPLYLPAGDGLIGLLSQSYYEYAEGKRSTAAPDPSYADQIEVLRGTLIEGIIEESEDESLMERYLEGEEIDQKVLIEDLERAVARGLVLPRHPGLQRLRRRHAGAARGRSTSGFPSPLEHKLPDVFTPHGVAAPEACRATRPEPLLAEVVKTTSDPYVGRVSLVRVFSGTIRPDTTVHVSGHFTSFFGDHNGARTGTRTMTRTSGSARCRSRSARRSARRRQVVAGDLCAIGRLTRAETGDTLSDKADPLLLRAVEHAGAVAADRRPGACEDRRGQARGRACSGWRPRIRRCGSSRTRRPTRSCCGAWARRTRTSYWTRWRTGTA